MFRMKIAFILLVACAVGYSSGDPRTATSVTVTNGGLRDAVTPPGFKREDSDDGFSMPSTITTAFSTPNKNDADSGSGDDKYHSCCVAPPPFPNPSKSEQNDANVAAQASSAEAAALKAEALTTFIRSVLLLPAEKALPAQGTALYAMLSDIGESKRQVCIPRVAALQPFIHPQYQRNLVSSLCQEGIELWEDEEFCRFLRCASLFLSKADDCVGIIFALSPFRKCKDHEVKMKMDFTAPFCLNRTSMDIYVILSVIQQSQKLPNEVDVLTRFFLGLPVEGFRDFMKKYQLNHSIEQAIMGYDGNGTPRDRYNFLRSLLER